MATVDFHDWSKPALLERADFSGPRPSAEIEIVFAEERAAGGGSRTVNARIGFELAASDAVRGLQPGAVTRQYPAPKAIDVEPTRLVLAEFDDPALPWLYTPEAPVGGSQRPWLVLLAGRPGDEEDPRDLTLHEDADALAVTLQAQLIGPLSLAMSHAWAHVQSLDGEQTSRLLSPTTLAPHTDYLAVLVPAFHFDGTNWSDSWRAGTTEAVRLPLYLHWKFRTGGEDDFLALARALTPKIAPPELGRAPVRYARLPLEPRLRAGGALTSPSREAPADPPTEPWPSVEELPAAIAADLSALRRFAGPGALDERGRPVIALPRYGETWSATDEAWLLELNEDPRHRGVAGLGVELAVAEQDHLVDLTMKKLGPVREAEQRVRHMAMGVFAARSLWRRRLPETPEDRVALLAPSMARVMTESGPLLDVVAAADRPLPRALFTSAAKRVLRSGPARTALADETASEPSALLRAANTCPAPIADPRGLPVVRPSPFDLGRPIDPTIVRERVDPASGGSLMDRTALDNLRNAVDGALQGDLGPQATADETTTRSSQTVTLHVTIPAGNGGGVVVPGPGIDTQVFVSVTVVAISTATGDQLEVHATGGREPWRLDILVAGQSLAQTGSGSASFVIDPRPSERRLLVQLTLSATGARAPDRRALVLDLATHLFSASLTPERWARTTVDAIVDLHIQNLSNRAISDAQLQVDGAALAVPVDVGPGESRTVTRAIQLPAAGDVVDARIVILGRASGTLELRRPAPRVPSYLTTPWLLPFALATASAPGRSGESERIWNELRGWAANATADTLDEWGADLAGTSVEGLDAATIRALGMGIQGQPQPPASAEPPCHPVNLAALDRALVRAFDPTSDGARVVERVNSTIAGRPPDAGTEPVGICPHVPLPVWELLRKHRPDWLLPGGSDVPQHAVVGLSTNAAFLESLMVGINQQLLAELSWRGLPIPPGCTPLRHCWGRIDTITGEPQPDITPIAGWRATPFTDASHREGLDESSLVVLVRTELFRRYPATVVYLLPAGADPSRPDFDSPTDHFDLPHVYPGFQGTLLEDLHFFGFPRTPAEGRGHWFVLEEPSRGFRFWAVQGDVHVFEQAMQSVVASGASGAHLAERTFANPIRVMIRGDEIVPDVGAPP
jgi:hypothetical protein